MSGQRFRPNARLRHSDALSKRSANRVRKSRRLWKLMRSLSAFAGCFALLVMILAWRIFGSQLERDRQCRDSVGWTKNKIEALRAQLGRLPTHKEVPKHYYGHSLLAYEPWSRDPVRLRKLGARGPQDYVLEFWRSERLISYYSWTEADDCDSEAWKAAIIFYGLSVPFAAALLWLGLRRRNES